MHQSIGYTDYSLKKFFETASKMPWYKNTLFIITADHTAISEKSFYQNRVGLFSIPIIFYSPSDSLLHGKNKAIIQQIDILPSVMDYLRYDLPYFAFGKSVFRNSGDGLAISFIDETFQLLQDGYSLILRNNEKNSLFNFTVDSTLLKDLAGIDTIQEKKMELELKSFIQNYNFALIHNEMK